MSPKSLQMRSDEGYLGGQFLVAMPAMSDQRFARSVIFLCAHSAEGAMGFIVNKLMPSIDFPRLLAQLELIDDGAVANASPRLEAVAVMRGGPVETGRGFLLHSPDVQVGEASVQIASDICLTSTLDILRLMAKGRIPAQAILVLGYASWGAGQLEDEIQRNDWLHCAADPILLFDSGIDTKYDRVMRQIGIDPRMLSANAGHA